MKVISILLLFFAINIDNAYSTVQDIGTRAFQFLKLPSDSKAEILLGDLNGIEGLYYNPSTLAYINNMELLASYSKFLGNVSYFSIAYGFPFLNIPYGKIALGINYLGYGEINDVVKNESEEGYDMCVSVGYGFGSEILKAGISFRYLYTKLFVAKGYSIGSDLGVDINLGNKARLNAVLKNLKFTGKVKENSVKLPFIYVISYVYKTVLENFEINANLSYQSMTDEGNYLVPALEFGSFEILYGRVCYRLNLSSSNQSSKGLSAGVGLKFGPLNIDFGWFKCYGEIGNLMETTLKFKF